MSRRSTVRPWACIWTAVALVGVVALAGGAARGEDAPPSGPPPTAKGDVTYAMGGETIADPYRWLEDDEASDVEAWDLAQHAWLRKTLDASPRREEVRAKVEAEMGLPGIRDLPHFEGGRAWFRSRPKGANHSILYTLPESLEGEPTVVIDPNAWAADGTEGLRDWFPSPDGKWLAYMRDSKGSERSTLYLRDLATGKDDALRLTRMKFSSFVWARDSSGFFYSRLPDPESVPAGDEDYHRRIRWHPLGGLLLDDEEVYGRGRDKTEDMGLGQSSDRQHLLLYRGPPYRALDVFEVETKGGARVLTPVLVGQDSRTEIDREGDLFLLNTDWKAPRRRVCVAKAGETNDASKWTTILAEGPGVIKDARFVSGRVLVHVLENVTSRLRVLALDGKEIGDVRLPGIGTVHAIATKPGDTRAWFTFESYDRPLSTYVVDLASAERIPTAIETTPTSVDVSRLVTERFEYASKDGTKIPVFVLRRKDVPLDGSAPTMLYGYGGFRVGMYPYYSSGFAIWADLGGVAAVACLRGGDEFGEDWHEAGCLGNKQNVFDDFIAGADWLVSSGKAKRERLAIRGGSNGGLLVAACVNQRPDLCRAAVCEVPLTDMLRYHRFQYAMEWANEYGNPDTKEGFAWIRPYSPVHNVKAGAAYPAVYLTAGLTDGRVNAFHARKIAALWQAATSSGRPILLRIDRSSGHGSASRLQAREEAVDRLCFLLDQLR